MKRHKVLAVRIAELTEDLEELRSEKALLLQKIEYAEDAGAEAFRKDIATMEAGLKKLEVQEQKYSVELDKALTEYAELKARAADFDPVELYEVQQTIREKMEHSAIERVKSAYGVKYNPLMMYDTKQDVAKLLNEDLDTHSISEQLHQKRQIESLHPRKEKHHEQGR